MTARAAVIGVIVGVDLTAIELLVAIAIGETAGAYSVADTVDTRHADHVVAGTYYGTRAAVVYIVDDIDFTAIVQFVAVAIGITRVARSVADPSGTRLGYVVAGT
jgi:uncharacterized protein with NRDE domain